MFVGVDHDIAYRQLLAGEIDVIDVYSTDAMIRRGDLVLLEDDRSFFPAIRRGLAVPNRSGDAVSIDAAQRSIASRALFRKPRCSRSTTKSRPDA